jgi:hypothetical protein
MDDARLTPGRPPMRPGEEIRHGLGEIPQRPLLHRLRTAADHPNAFLASVN